MAAAGGAGGRVGVGRAAEVRSTTASPRLVSGAGAGLFKIHLGASAWSIHCGVSATKASFVALGVSKDAFVALSGTLGAPDATVIPPATMLINGISRRPGTPKRS